MMEIRLCWSCEVATSKREESTSNLWSEANSDHVNSIRLMCNAGNERFGIGSHWIEMRLMDAGLSRPQLNPSTVVPVHP